MRSNAHGHRWHRLHFQEVHKDLQAFCCEDELLRRQCQAVFEMPGLHLGSQLEQECQDALLAFGLGHKLEEEVHGQKSPEWCKEIAKKAASHVSASKARRLHVQLVLHSIYSKRGALRWWGGHAPKAVASVPWCLLVWWITLGTQSAKTITAAFCMRNAAPSTSTVGPDEGPKFVIVNMWKASTAPRATSTYVGMGWNVTLCCTGLLLDWAASAMASAAPRQQEAVAPESCMAAQDSPCTIWALAIRVKFIMTWCRPMMPTMASKRSGAKAKRIDLQKGCGETSSKHDMNLWRWLQHIASRHETP